MALSLADLSSPSPSTNDCRPKRACVVGNVDSMEGDITGTQDIATVYETIFLFLKNQNLFKTAETLEKECEIVIPNASGKVFFRTYQRLGIVGKPTKSFVDKRIVLETFSQTQTDSTNMKKDAKKPCSLNCDLLRSRFCQLQEEYKKLLAVTCELTNALQMNILGQAQNVSCVLEECKNIYPSLFETSTEENKAGFWESPEAKIESRLSRDGESDALEKPEPELIYSNVPQLNLDCFQHDQSTSSSNHLSPHTPLTEREIKNILENILKRVLSILEQNEKGYSTDGTNDCCDSNQTCNDCKNEISKMLDRIVFKVLESPRCRTSRPSPVRRHSASTASCRTKLEMQPINTMAKNNEYLIKVPSEVENKAANDSGNKNDNVYDDLSENQQIKDRAVSLEDVMRSQNKSISHSRNDDLPSTNINSHTCSPTQRFIKNEDVTKNPSNKKMSLEQRSPRQQRPSMDSKRLKPPVFRYFSYAKTPMCYMEHCRLLQDGNRNCRCMKCVPGQSRYYCGCYDIISKEIDEEVSNISNEQASIRTNYFKNIHRRREIGIPPILEQYIYGSKCSLCEDMICKCAFESRPKLRRTPPDESV